MVEEDIACGVPKLGATAERKLMTDACMLGERGHPPLISCGY